MHISDCVQYSDSRTVMPESPILILFAPPLSAARVARAHVGDAMVLGLSLTQRAVMAARRAGYRQVVLLAANGHATP